MTALHSVQRLVEAVIGISEKTAVLQVTSEGTAGSVFIDDGRISWAAVPQTRRFLSERLAARGIQRALIDETRAQHRPLSDLVRTGAITRDAFSSVLFDHTVESLAHLVSCSIARIEVMPWTGASVPDFSFPALSLISQIALRHTSVPSAVEPQSADLIALTVINRDDVLVPVRSFGRVVPDLRTAMELSIRGADMMARLGSGSASFRREGRCWSVAGTPAAFVVSAGDSALSYAWMVGQR